jgi:hypothetical protein
MLARELGVGINASSRFSAIDESPLRARGGNRLEPWQVELNRFAVNEDPRLDLLPFRAKELRVETHSR